MIRIVNHKTWKPQAGDVYIGRPSPLGNKYIAKKEQDKTKVVISFQKWMRVEYKKRSVIYTTLNTLASRYKAGESLNLVCWCAPPEGLTVEDRPGVLGEITSVFGSMNVGLLSVIQRGRDIENENKVTLVLVTHYTKEGNILNSIDSVCKLNSVYKINNIIRMEEFN